MYVITQKIMLEREIWDIIKKRRKKVKEGIYFNVLLPRFVRDRDFKNYLGIFVNIPNHKPYRLCLPV